MNPELSRVKLSLAEKSGLYRELGRLLRGGRAFSSALDIMLENTRGNLARFLKKLRVAAMRGEEVSAAFAAEQPAISELEIGILTASQKAGRLDQACAQLSSYFGALAKARATIARRMIYPAFILHFAVLTTALPALVTGGSLAGFLKQTMPFLLTLYAGVFVLWMLVRAITKAAGTNASLDALLRAVPFAGRIRRGFALARFCTTYEAQTVAGVNVFDAVSTAAKASGSGMILQTVRKGMPQLHAGATVGSLLQKSRAFPASMSRSFRMAEETGEIDAELARLTAEFESDALARAEMLGDLLPKALFLLIAIYVGYLIVQGYRSSMGDVEKLLEE